MSKLKSLSLTLSVTALTAATPALADITADELWSIWQTQGAGMGYTISGQSTPSGDGLVLTNVTNTFEVEGVTIASVLPEVILNNRSDGTVAITIGETFLYRITGINEPDAPSEITILFDIVNHSGVASGDAQNLTIESSFEEIRFASSSQDLNMGNLSFVGGDLSEMPGFDALISIQGLSNNASYDFTNPDLIGVAGEGSLDAITISLDASEPMGSAAPAPQPVAPAPGKTGPAPANPAPVASGDGGQMNLLFEISDFQTTMSGVLPTGIDYMNIEAFPAGMVLESDSTYGSANIRFAFQDRWDSIDLATSNDGGMFGFAMSQDAMSYALGGQNVQWAVSGAELPFLIEAAADSTAFSIDIPLSQQPTPSPFATSIAYEGVTVGDQIWAMVDPAGAIPRGPATLIMDVTGLVQVFTDIATMDPMAFQGPPGELRQVTLNNLQVSVAGAELTGMGDVSFAPGSIIPQPIGSVDLNLSGANGLITTLTNAGLLPPQQGGMMRGMLGMFARPGATPDTYSSTIEFLPGGSITANGVPLQ